MQSLRRSDVPLRWVSGVEEDLGRGLPVARRTTPAFGMLGRGRLIEEMAPGQRVVVLPAMTLIGGDEHQATPVVFGVVPARKCLRPAAGLVQVRKGLVGEAGVGLEGTKQSREHGHALHGRAVVGVQQEQGVGAHPFALVGLAEDVGGLGGVDPPADDLAAVKDP